MIIPATHTEIEQIYLALEANNARTACITSCYSGDGVTSVATALTERYLLAGQKALLVDLNTYKPAFSPVLAFDSENDELNSPLLIEHNESKQLFTGVNMPSAPSSLLVFKDPTQLKTQIEQWGKEFDRIIFDTSPLLHRNQNSIPAQVVASSCDQTLLVVLSSSTTSDQLKKARTLVERNENIQLLGSVMNLKTHASLGHEIARKLASVPLIPTSWKQRWCNKLIANPFLSTPA